MEHTTELRALKDAALHAVKLLAPHAHPYNHEHVCSRRIVEAVGAVERSRGSHLIDIYALETIRRALALAEEEIHHPGAARAGNYDVLDLIEQARKLVERSRQDETTHGVPG